MLYYNARFYLPNTNRFISADTIVPNPANPQSFNRYSYALNNPIRLKDSSGHCQVAWTSPATGETMPDMVNAGDCWNYLNNLFCEGLDCGAWGWQRWVIVNESSEWTLQSLMSLKEALLATKATLGYIGYDYNTVLNQYQFAAKPTLGDASGLHYGGSYLIELSLNGNHIYKTALHEIGHAIDWVSGNKVVESWIQMTSSGIRKDGNGDFVFETGTGYYYSEYGRYGRRKDGTVGTGEPFAEAYAAYAHYIYTGGTFNNVQIDTQYRNVVELSPGGWKKLYDAVEVSIMENYGDPILK